MDKTLGILLTGYPYFLEKFEKEDSDIIQTRLLLSKTIVLKGEEGAALFYDTDKFKRKGAMPKRAQKTLLGEGGVQGLDGEAHLRRKAMFMQCMGSVSINRLHQLFMKYWLDALQQWEKSDHVSLFYETEKILLRASCEWIGIPLPENKIELRRSQVSAMIDSAAAVFIRHIRGRKARKEAEYWMEQMIEEVRNEHLKIEESSILWQFSQAEDLDGNRLEVHVAAVELLNLIRPIVAIARYVVFGALALEENKQYKKSLYDATDEDYRCFVQEVRRFYPFFPFIAAIVKKDFDWQGHHFVKGRRVILDLYGTNHDKKIWDNPMEFNPDRFKDWSGSPFNFIPQGGGGHYNNHRCAGEWITINLTQAALKLLIGKMNYEVPQQDLSIDLSRIPAIPKSRFIMRKVRPL